MAAYRLRRCKSYPVLPPDPEPTRSPFLERRCVATARLLARHALVGDFWERARSYERNRRFQRGSRVVFL